MKEDFLHYIWKQKKYQSVNLKTVDGSDVLVKSSGTHNHLAGPDFFNAQITIGNQLWAGNVEIHLKSSDWYVHNHETDSNYDNVILHVVWEHDADIFRNDNSVIPTLELKNYINQSVLDNYQKLFSKSSKWINCEKDFPDVDDFVLKLWLERLYIERLEQKSEVIQDLLNKSKNNWEAVLFGMLAKNFGLNINGEAFLSMSQSFDFSIVRKLQSNQQELEALFLGQMGLMNADHQDRYFIDLKDQYHYIKHKFKLDENSVLPAQFYKLRPPNFPTIRLAQLAALYYKQHNLFSELISKKDLTDLYQMFEISVSDYWQTHYNFGTVSSSSKKALTKAFINLLLINTIIPIKFAYSKSRGNENTQDIFELIRLLPAEKNSIIEKFQDLKKEPFSAYETQAYIQLKKQYCDKNKCLQCAIGNALLSE
ncbi:DUF2851 family protein [Hanstruepera ponticola]|uniref:DUF2851 family protein n=1 Tax=Hanstruepera ponticola TaxID=2042995 RepID=UPI000CF133E3|nr:DUF2851 family protein [Hanstruepera ponticola]